MDVSSHELSRRTIVRGAVWSVPVIAAAVAVPMAVASDTSAENGLDFYVTAYNVSGSGSAFGFIQANGIRISPQAGTDAKIIAEGTDYTITIAYTGTDDEFSFRNTAHGLDYQIGQNTAPGRWASVVVEDDRIVLTFVTPYATAEPTTPDFHWDLGPAGRVVRPEDDSIRISGVANLARGGGFPDGGTLAPLTLDPNGGTGTLTGPGQHGDGQAQTWP